MDDSVNPFDSFKLVTKILIWTGCYEIQSNKKHIRACHYLYRISVLLLFAVYNILHILFVVMTDYDVASRTYSLVIEIPQMNLFVKTLTMFIHTSRIRRLNQLINDPIFAATSKEDAEYLVNNNRNMIKLTKFTFVSVTIAGLDFFLSFIFKRMEDPNSIVPAYMPFDTTSTFGYAMSVLLETGPLPWIAYGHLMADSIIAIYYSQATAQLKLFKYNLEHIFDGDGLNTLGHGSRERSQFQFKDLTDEKIRKRFIYLVERHKKVTWFVDEVTHVFERSMSFQFFSATLSSCLVVYQLSLVDIMSMMFLHMFTVLLIFQCQVFLYCYFGYLVEYESESINSSMYFSDWLSVSPRLRREILIAMTRWEKPLTPRVSTIVPVSVVTFVSIVKSAYRLYTVMKSTHL